MRCRQVVMIVGVLMTAVALSGIGLSRAGSEDKPAGSVEEWEYLMVGSGNVNLTPTENTSMRKEPGPFAREDYAVEGNLDKLGKKGWELVTVTESPRFGPTFIFKRRK